eukprot:sb/3463942/
MCIILPLYFPAFGGYIPYSDWECATERCEGLVANYSGEGSPYNKKVLCEMDPGVDITWTWKTTTYTVEWGLVCGEEYKATLISSLYFVGGAIGLLIGSTLFDTLGRRRCAMAGHFGVALCMMITAVAPNMAFFMAVRVLLGMGTYLGLAGTYVYILELTSNRWRGFISSFMGMMWGIGLGVLAPGLSLAFSNWRILCGVEGGVFLLAASSWILFPESPKYLVENRGDVEGAKMALKQFARLYGGPFSAEKTDLVPSNLGAGTSTFMDGLRDFIRYPELRIQLLIQLWQWIVIAFLYYGFNFGWSKLGSNLLLSYLFAGVAEVVAANLAWFSQDVIGRKRTIVITFFLAGISFLVAIAPVKFGTQDVLTMQQLMSLVGSTMVSLCWGTMYLYTNEQSPTNHRGKMSCLCSVVARFGSFAGPMASLMFDWNKTATFVFFSALAFSSGLMEFRMPETKGKRSPNSAKEEPIETSKQPIKTRYLGHVTGYQPIRDEYFLIRSVPDNPPKLPHPEN